MSYRYNPLVGQKLSYASFFQTCFEATDRAHTDEGYAQQAALQEAITFELINTLKAFLSEIADNYGLAPSCSDAKTLSSELANRGIVSPEVEEILLSINNDGWISSLLNQHHKNCSGSVSALPDESIVQPLRFAEVEQTVYQSNTGYWLGQLSALIDRHREGLVEW